jgi:hypothetical protein
MPSRISSLSNLDLAQRLLAILINASEGRRSVGDDSQFRAIRKEFLRRKLLTPGLVEAHPTTDSFSAFIRGIKSKTERVEEVRKQFRPLIDGLISDREVPVNSADWTGIKDPKERIIAVRTLLPLAQSAIEGMIAALGEQGENGGPILDERAEAISNLKALHRALGDLVDAAESGQLEDGLGEGLAAEAARYAKRAAQALRSDPMPYVASSLLLGLLTTCGLPGIGGYLSGVALAVRKNAN